MITIRGVYTYPLRRQVLRIREVTMKEDHHFRDCLYELSYDSLLSTLREYPEGYPLGKPVGFALDLDGKHILILPPPDREYYLDVVGLVEEMVS